MQYLPHQYNLDNIIYSIPEEIDGNRIIKIYDNKLGKPLYIQTPELTNIFGAINKNNYYELLLPLGGVSCLLFKQFLFNLQNKILFDTNIHKNVWFQDQKSVKFIPIIKEINKDVTSTMEQTEELYKCDDGMLKIKVTNNTIVKKENVEISINELTKNNKIRMIIQIYAIWINKVNNKLTFGIYLKPEIIEEKNSYNLSFIEDKILCESDDDCDESYKDIYEEPEKESEEESEAESGEESEQESNNN